MNQKKKLLLLHHTPYHFEVLLAFAANFRDAFDLSVWCFSLSDLNRGKLIEQLHIRLHQPGAKYDYVIVLSGDEPDSTNGLNAELDSILLSTPILNVMHQYHGVDREGCLYVFPTAGKPIIMATTGLKRAQRPFDNETSPMQFLVQGHVDGRRRAYNRLLDLEDVEGAMINIVGGGMPENCPSGRNIRHHLRIDEISFHENCSKMDFIIPLIDPDIHAQYFNYAFSSSILIGFSYSLPFIAHEQLFELYPIKGFSYSNYDDMKLCIQKAANLSQGEYSALSDQISSVKAGLLQSNLSNLQNGLPKFTESYQKDVGTGESRES